MAVDLVNCVIQENLIAIRDIRKNDLRRSLSMVIQDTHLFTGTIADNIRYSRLDASSRPPVLILDEATSPIDTRTEILIEKGMDTLMDGHTVFVIAHCLSTVRNSKVIMVFERGTIIKRGSHEELLTQKGRWKMIEKKDI